MQYENRVANLRNVLAWSKEFGGLTSGQQTSIHQEIAARLQNIEALEWDDEGFINDFSVSLIIEGKINHILMVIKNTGWKRQEIKY